MSEQRTAPQPTTWAEASSRDQGQQRKQQRTTKTTPQHQGDEAPDTWAEASERDGQQ